MTLTRRLMILAASTALALGTALAVPGASSANTNAFIATPNGMVGLQQEVVVRAPNLAGQVATISFTSGAISNAGQTAINAQGFGSLAWTPTSAGSWTIAGAGNTASVSSTTISVAAMPTTTAALVPNLVQTGVANALTIVVSAPLGVLPPTGTVTVRNQFQNQLASGTLVASSGTTSTATVSWTPANGDAITAFYTPAPGSGFAASQSGQFEPVTTTARVPVALRFPGTLYVGSPTIIGAQTGFGVTPGSAAFFFDGVGIIGSTPTDANGGISAVWTPPVAGVHTISTEFSSSDGRFTGTSSQVVNIQPAQPRDSLTITAADGSPWSPGSPIALRTGTSVNLTVTTASGATGVLSEEGPCVINGTTLTALGTGQCTITATSPGSDAITPATATYVVTVTAPPRRPRGR